MQYVECRPNINDSCQIGNESPEEIQVIPFGTHRTDKGAFMLDAEGIKEAITDFESRANDMVVDYEHQSLGEGEAPAAGWIKRLIDKGSRGLWAAVQWTPRALEYLRNREYRYLSPVFMKRASDGRVVRLLGAALTNTPAIDGMVPLINKQQQLVCDEKPRKEGKVMTKLLSALGLTAGATEEEAIKSVETLKAKSDRAAVKEVLSELGLGEGATVSETVGAVLAMKQAGETLSAVREEMEELRAALSAKEGESLVAQAMTEGKITPAQREWAETYAGMDPEGFKVFVSRSPVVVPRGSVRTIGEPAQTGASGELQLSVNRLLMVSDEAFNKFSYKED